MQYKLATAVQHFLLLLQKKTLAKEKEPEGISISPQTPLNRPRKPLRFSWIFPAKLITLKNQKGFGRSRAPPLQSAPQEGNIYQNFSRTFY